MGRPVLAEGADQEVTARPRLRLKMRHLRIAAAVLGIGIVGSGVVGKVYYGGICNLGTTETWVACPLGWLERSLAARELLPEWPGALLVVLSVILLGRVFCAWLCPTALVKTVFRGNGGASSNPVAIPGSNMAAYSSYAVLGAVLFASFWFRFPIFCFFCPVGLFFGALYAVLRVFAPDPSFSLELVLFPAFLFLEIGLLKSWCRSFCPLGALLSLIGNFNPFLRPTVDKSKCFAEKGVNCQACRRACPEGIDLTRPRPRFTPNACTKCLECSDRCPLKGIKFPVRA